MRWPFTVAVRGLSCEVCAYGYTPRRGAIGPPRHAPFGRSTPHRMNHEPVADAVTGVRPSGRPGPTGPCTWAPHRTPRPLIPPVTATGPRPHRTTPRSPPPG